MDGYAIRMSQLLINEPIPIRAESVPGAAPPTMLSDGVIEIFTGAMIPQGAEAVVRREDVEELGGSIRWKDVARQTSPGNHIRRAGENVAADAVVLTPGLVLTAAKLAILANFGYYAVDVYATVRVSIITTGNEVGVFEGQKPDPWQVRDSNRATISSMLNSFPWIDVIHVDHCRDERQALRELMATRLQESDVVISTGGVSMGDYDYIPDIVQELGGEIVFHRLPIRPGKPVLGATIDGKLMMGLPGNPVSAAVCCRRILVPLLAKMSGQKRWHAQVSPVHLVQWQGESISLHWFRLVSLEESGKVRLVKTCGSGDIISLGLSDGFIECGPNESGLGPWPYFSWPSVI
jgi:molybdenum cofactor synthesis domain-containing protein